MFGYLKVDKDELRLKDIKKYQSIYCGLCNRLRKEYGILYSIFLTYECVFLYFYLLLVFERKDKVEIITRCPLNPLIKKRIILDDEIMEYVTFINILLVEIKCRDDIEDEDSVIKKVLDSIICKNVKFVQNKEKYEELVIKIEHIIKQFGGKEKTHCSIDECMSPMGDFLQCIVSYFLYIKGLNDNINTEYISIANCVGKWFYVIDAFDDMEKDKKSGSFNPLLLIKENNNDDYQQRVARIMLQMISMDINKRFEQLEMQDCEIVENVLKYGLQRTLKRIMFKKEKECKRQYKIQVMKAQIKNLFSIKQF